MTPFISKLSAICIKKKLIEPEDVPWFEYGVETRIATAISMIPFTLLAVRLSDIPTALAFLAIFKFLKKDSDSTSYATLYANGAYNP